jgi:hypothetical protein
VVSVVSLFGLDGCEVVAVLKGATVVEPVDPFGGGDCEVVEALPRTPGLDQFGLVEPITDSASALSCEDPTAPVEGLIPAVARCSE